MKTAQLHVEPLEGTTFGARITGVDLADVDEATGVELHRLWLQYGLLLFPGQSIDEDQQIAFANRFGEIELLGGKQSAYLSNIKEDGSLRADTEDSVKVLKGNMAWHMDSTYMPLQAKGAVFSAHIVPGEGGATGWADMRAAYDALDDATRAKVEGLAAYHSLVYSQGKVGHTHTEGTDYMGYGFHGGDDPLRPLVKVHPETGRKALVIGRHAYGIPGMEQDEAQRLMEELAEIACQPPRVYEHDWTPGDVVLWDNRCLMHRARPWDMTVPRVMLHVRIAGDRPSELAVQAN